MVRGAVLKTVKLKGFAGSSPVSGAKMEETMRTDIG